MPKTSRFVTQFLFVLALVLPSHQQLLGQINNKAAASELTKRQPQKALTTARPNQITKDLGQSSPQKQPKIMTRSEVPLMRLLFLMILTLMFAFHRILRRPFQKNKIRSYSGGGFSKGGDRNGNFGGFSGGGGGFNGGGAYGRW
jgi:uncharacterized membrane protein YgcG